MDDPFDGLREFVPGVDALRPACEAAVAARFGRIHDWVVNATRVDGEAIELTLSVRVPPRDPKPYTVRGRVPRDIPGRHVIYSGFVEQWSHVQPVPTLETVRVTIPRCVASPAPSGTSSS